MVRRFRDSGGYKEAVTIFRSLNTPPIVTVAITGVTISISGSFGCSAAWLANYTTLTVIPVGSASLSLIGWRRYRRVEDARVDFPDLDESCFD